MFNTLMSEGQLAPEVTNKKFASLYICTCFFVVVVFFLLRRDVNLRGLCRGRNKQSKK